MGLQLYALYIVVFGLLSFLSPFLFKLFQQALAILIQINFLVLCLLCFYYFLNLVGNKLRLFYFLCSQILYVLYCSRLKFKNAVYFLLLQRILLFLSLLTNQSGHSTFFIGFSKPCKIAGIIMIFYKIDTNLSM